MSIKSIDLIEPTLDTVEDKSKNVHIITGQLKCAIFGGMTY